MVDRAKIHEMETFSFPYLHSEVGKAGVEQASKAIIPEIDRANPWNIYTIEFTTHLLGHEIAGSG